MSETSADTVVTSVETSSPRLRWGIYLLLLSTFTGLALASILRVEPLLSANDRSRWATVRALVDHDTWQIDEVIKEPRWDSIDKVRHEEHFYSSKPPLIAALVAGVYWGVQKTTDFFDGGEQEDGRGKGWTLQRQTAETTRFILVIVNLLPMLIALWVICLIAERYATRDFTRFFLVIAAATGTYLTTYLVTLNNHTMAATSLIFALYPTLRIVADDEPKRRYFLLAGFFAAFTCTCELPAAAFGLGLFFVLCWKSWQRTLSYFVPMALIPLATYFYTNYEVTGGIKPFYAYYGTEKYEYTHNGVPSYWMNPKGMDKAGESTGTYLTHCLIGHHGVFSLTPVFALTLLSWLTFWQWRTHRLQIVLGLGFGLTLLVLGFYLTRTSNYNYGGNTAGLRWMFWLIPFWLLTLIPFLDHWSKFLSVRIVMSLCLAVSVFSSAYSQGNPWRPSWLFNLMERWEWIDYSDPPPEPLQRRLHGWLASLPDRSEESELQWVRFGGTNADGSWFTVRIEETAEMFSGERTIRHLLITENEGRTDERCYLVPIDEFLFVAENPPVRYVTGIPPVAAETATFLESLQLWGWSPSFSQKPTAELVTFLRGFPGGPVLFQGGRTGYVNSSLQQDAFFTRKVAARIRYRPASSPRQFDYQCEAWLCEDVPFGTLRVKFTVFTPGSSTPQAVRWFHLIGASGF